VRRALLLVLTCSTVAAGCGTSDVGSSGKPVVVATSTQVADLVRNVAGDHAEVEQILEPGADPHDFEPRPSDAVAVERARLVFRSGGDVDGWLDDLLANAGGDAKVVDLSGSVSLRAGGHAHGEEEHADSEHDHDADEEEADPHWWQDPRNARAAVRRIAADLAAADPEHAAAYRANAARYDRRLARLDAAIATCLRRIPARERKLVTNHDALAYYAERYGIEVVGTVIPSLSTQGQPSAGEIAELADTIRRENVRAIFPESSLEPKLERALARETGARVGAALWADALGKEGSDGDTYLKSLAANTRSLAAGFTDGRVRCALPE
jgi:zinc/manganese transport system substrate-binding protein/manganese/iron transport system substrate-binding protein